MSINNQDQNTKNNQNNHITDFGYEQVNWNEKQSKVDQVFHSVADKYDIMNDLMSAGVHRIWKHKTIAKAKLRAGQKVLDLAGGTGDLTKQIAQKVAPTGSVILSDINQSMIQVGKDRLLNLADANIIDYVQANAQILPFANNSFHAVTMAFGLRNCTDKQAVLNEIHRVLKPAGKCLILEFSHPIVPGLKAIYDAYSFTALPLLGKIICNDSKSYKYLAESIRKHPDQETLAQMLTQAGLSHAKYENFSGGIVALHTGVKL